MSLSPDNEKRLDRWLLGLAFAINGSRKLDAIPPLDDETDTDYQTRLFSAPSHSQKPDEFGLYELAGILRQMRYGAMVDANVLFGFKKKRGGQKDFDKDRIWGIILSWIVGMRTLGVETDKRTLDDFLSVIEHAGQQGWIKAQGIDKSVLEKNLSAFKSKGDTCFTIYGGIKDKTEQDVVDYLELQTLKAPNIHSSNQRPELVLWAMWPGVIGPSEKDPCSLQWAVEKPEGSWYQASLDWSECDSTDQFID